MVKYKLCFINDNRGFAYITVLLSVILLSAVVTQVLSMTSLKLTVYSDKLFSAKARYSALSGMVDFIDSDVIGFFKGYNNTGRLR